MDLLTVVYICSLVLASVCAMYLIIPNVLVSGANKIVKYVFYTRNQLLQMVFCVLMTLGYVVFILDMLPVLTRFHPDGSHVFIPILLLFINFAFYQLCCQADPGWITKRNVDTMVEVYKYDSVLYETGTVCRTCKTAKPARSKHCTFCNRCVHRFDHHCLWTNSCIGAFNLRYFLLFLLSLVAVCVNGVLVCGHCLQLLIVKFCLLEKTYTDDVTGQMQPITYLMLLQGLFMKFPRIVVLLGSLLVLLMLLIPFTAYHLYLAGINTTTNERFKVAALHQQRAQAQASSASSVDHPAQVHAHGDGDYTGSSSKKGKSCTQSCSSGGCGHTDLLSNHSLNSSSSRDADLASHGFNNGAKLQLGRKRFYDRGVVKNFCEVFLPQTPQIKVDKLNSDKDMKSEVQRQQKLERDKRD